LFDRCDGETVAVLQAGCAEARRLGHDYLGTEHLLLALVGRRGALPEPVAELLPSEDAVRAALSRHVGERPSLPQGELLATLGVDLGDVRAAVRRTFGPEAVERLRRPVHQPWQPWRRPSRRCTSLLAGTLLVACRAKEAFENARRDAERRQLGSIDPAALLTGMAEVQEAMANRLLRDSGIDLDQLRIILAEATA